MVSPFISTRRVFHLSLFVFFEVEGWVLVLESSWFNVGVVRLLGEDHSLRDLFEEALELRDLGLVPLDLLLDRRDVLGVRRLLFVDIGNSMGTSDGGKRVKDLLGLLNVVNKLLHLVVDAVLAHGAMNDHRGLGLRSVDDRGLGEAQGDSLSLGLGRALSIE